MNESLAKLVRQTKPTQPEKKTMRPTFVKWSFASLLIAFALLLAAGVQAANSWDAGGGANVDWDYQSIPGTYDNWDDNNLPVAGVDLVFGTAGSTANLNLNVQAGKIVFNRAAAFTIAAGGGTLNLAGGIDFTQNNILYKIGAPVVVAANQSWTSLGFAGLLEIDGSLSGSGNLRIFNTGFVTRASLNGNNSNYSGRILVESTNTGTADRYTTLEANGSNSLGTGQAEVRNSRLRYTPGATATGGLGVRVLPSGEMLLNGVPTAADLFDIRRDGGIRGTAAQLAGLVRGGNITLERGAVVGHGALDSGTGSFGTAADLIFGVNGTFNNAALTLAAGASTPWLGIGTGINSTTARLDQGTVAIDATGVDEFVLQGFGRLGGGGIITGTAFILGNNTVAPLFNLAAGAPVPARIRNAVTLDFDTAGNAFSAFSGFTLADESRLTVSRQHALAGGSGGTAKPLTFEGGQLLVSNATSNNVAGTVTIARGPNDMILTTATTELTLASLSRTANQGGLLLLVDRAAAGGYTLGTNEKIKVGGGVAAVPTVAGHTDGAGGNMVRPFIFGVDSNRYASVDLLTYDAAVGFKLATYHGSNLDAASGGQIVKTAGANALTGNRSALATVIAGSLTGNFTLSLGVDQDGNRAAEGALLAQGGGGASVAPHLDFGTAEGIVYMFGSQGNRRLTLSGGVTAANGLIVYARPIVNLESNNNNVSGLVSILGPQDMQISERPGGTAAPSTLRLNGGNGLNSDAVVYLSGNAALELGRDQTVAGLYGTGWVMNNVTFEGGVAAGHRRLTVDTSGDYVFDGTLRDSGVVGSSLGLTKAGPGSLTLTGTNHTHSGETIVQAGTLALALSAILRGGGAYSVVGGKLVVDGEIMAGAGLVVMGGGTLAGSGLAMPAVTIGANGIISPGNSVGTLTTGAETWAGGGTYLWEINRDSVAGGSVGSSPGWDLLLVDGLEITATSANPFIVQIASLGLNNLPGLADFELGSSQQFLIADSEEAILGFAADKFQIDAGGFANYPGSSWAIYLGSDPAIAGGDGTQLYLAFTKIPEPTSAALLALAGLAGRRRRR